MNIDSAWPVMVNALIAKLVAYDALMLAAKGSLLHFLGGDYTQSTGQGGPISKIETGPSNVEYHSISSALEQLLKGGAQGSTLDGLTSDICGLASFLKVKVPMCKGRKMILGPKYYQNQDWLRVTDAETVVSQGSTETTL